MEGCWRQSQAGAALVEVIAGCCVVGTLAAATLSKYQDYQSLGLDTTAQLTASALASAVNLKRAEWAIDPAVFAATPLVVNGQGIATGLDSIATATASDCTAIWHHLVVAEAPLMDAAPALSSSARDRYWHIGLDGERCLYQYHHAALPVVSVYYHTQTGDVGVL